MMLALPAPFVEIRPADLRAELAAAACLAECCSALRLSEIPIPVPVEEWVKRPLHIDFGFDTMPERVAPADGYALLGRNFIRISETLTKDERVRWTIAHELGHLRLHEPGTRLMSREDPDYFNIYRNEVERQAERFAGAFLMPPTQLVQALFRVCAECRLDAERTIKELLSNSKGSRYLWDRAFLPRLGEMFQVSRYGVLFRIGELRTRDGSPFILPRTFVILSAQG